MHITFKQHLLIAEPIRFRLGVCVVSARVRFRFWLRLERGKDRLQRCARIWVLGDEALSGQGCGLNLRHLVHLLLCGLPLLLSVHEWRRPTLLVYFHVNCELLSSQKA